MTSIKVPLHSRKYPGLFAIVDEDDADLVLPHRWYPARSPRKTGDDVFYAVTNIDGRLIQMHREINQTPEGLATDHIDGDGLNNTKVNLRTVTPSQNVANFHTPIRSTLGYIGVVRHSQRVQRQFQAKVRGASIGSFDTAEEAARAVDTYRRVIWGDHVRLNFPDEQQDIPEVIPNGPEYARGKTSRYRGVSWSHAAGKWYASIKHRDRSVGLGVYASEIAAARAYDWARVTLGLKPVNEAKIRIDEERKIA